MEKPSYLEEQKKAIARFAGTFLKQKFAFPPQSIKVLMDHDLVVLRIDKFLCPAELNVGMEKGNASMIHEMYSKIFDKVKLTLVEKISQITCKKVISSQISINFETQACIMTFFLSCSSS